MHNKRLWSDGLGRFVQVKVRARVLRTIDKCGGLDEYLLGEKPGRVKELGVAGWGLRWLVSRTGKVRRRVEGQREALGLPATTTRRGKATRAEGSAGVDTLEDEVERASGEVVGRIGGGGAHADSKGLSEAEAEELGYGGSSVDPPSSKPTALEDHINRTIQAVEAETMAEAARPAHQAQKTPSHYSKGEKRAWRAAQALLNPDQEGELATEGESALMAEVAMIEEVVEAEMDGLKVEGRVRLAMAMGRLRSASQELELVKAGGGAAEEKGLEKEKEAQGGILAKIKGLFGRR